MRTTGYIIRLGLGLCWAWLCVAPGGLHAAEQLADEELLALLPPGARLADDISSLEPEGAAQPQQAKRNYVYCADTDGDGQDEIVVAYYSEPHEYVEPKTEAESWASEAYYSRGHIRALHWDGQKYTEQWDSGGGGCSFARFAPKPGAPVPERDRAYAMNVFSVRDITGDGRPEILCTRIGLRWVAFRAWTWDGKQYASIAEVDAPVRIEDTDGDGKQEIIVDTGDRGVPLEQPIVFKWNGQSYAATEEHWRDRFLGIKETSKGEGKQEEGTEESEGQ